MKTRRKKKLTLIHGVNSIHSKLCGGLVFATWVCFICRVAKRESPSYGFPTYKDKPKCQHCGEPMRGIGTSWRIPCRSKVRAWKRMEEIINWTPRGRAIRHRDRKSGYGAQLKRQPGVRRQRFF